MEKEINIVDYKDYLVKSHQSKAMAKSLRSTAGTYSRGLGR